MHALRTTFLAILACNIGVLAASAQASGDARIVRIVPPEAGFFAKRLDYRGIPIKAHATVSDDALKAARQRLDMMLAKVPDVVHNLVANGAQLHIIGKDQVTSDLPEYQHLKGKPFDGKLTVDQRTRGLGGLAASCGEENLLRLPGDRYAGRDICVHEFAHTIRRYGLSPDIRKKIAVQYQRSITKGLWKNAYASSNDDEFFAELSMWYFGTHGDTARLSPRPAKGKEGLRAYDPEAFELLDGIYSGKTPVATINRVRLTALPVAREGTLKSAADSRPTSVLFVNDTSGELKIYWLDFEGKRKLYGSVQPGGRYHVDTFIDHAWVVVDAKGVARAVFVAQPSAGQAVIEDAPRP